MAGTSLGHHGVEARQFELTTLWAEKRASLHLTFATENEETHVSILFASYKSNACSLCGATKDLSGEHKIKASALRAEFGTDHMIIGRFGDATGNLKHVQSAKSAALHFTARICEPCNNARTQAADREFDRFHQAVSARIANNEDPKLFFDDERYSLGSDAYLNVFRYFAKLLCCHIADVGAPRPLRMSQFALGEASSNCIWLKIDEDWDYKQASAQLGAHQYAAHGGLVVYGHKKTGGAKGFHSTLTVGRVRYIFFSRLTSLEQLVLRICHRKSP